MSEAVQMCKHFQLNNIAQCTARNGAEPRVWCCRTPGKTYVSVSDVSVSQDEFLVVDSSLQLVPPAVEPPPPRPASPPLPPGVLSAMEQLQSAVAAMQAAEQPAGCLAVQSAAELLLGLASQGAG